MIATNGHQSGKGRIQFRQPRVLVEDLDGRRVPVQSPGCRRVVGNEGLGRLPTLGAVVKNYLQGLATQPIQGRRGWRHLITEGVADKSPESQIDEVGSLGIRIGPQSALQGHEITVGQRDPSPPGRWRRWTRRSRSNNA